MTQNGSIDIQDVQEKFDELQSWDKKNFILKNIDNLDEYDFDTICDSISIKSHDICKRLTPYEISECFSSRELLDEIGNDDIVYYLSHQILSAEQIIDIVKTTINYSSEQKNKAIKEELLHLIENL